MQPILLIPSMEVAKKKTTIAFVKDNWVKLQNLAAIQNTSPTSILNQLLESYVDSKLPEDYDKRIEDRVYSQLDEKIDEKIINKIAFRVISLLETNNDTTRTSDTIEIIDADIKSDATSTTDTTKEDREVTNLAKFNHYKALDNKKGFSDQQVAGIEGVSKETVRRYRKGKRSPKQEFIDRWGLSWNGNQWIRNEERPEYLDYI